ncbi:MAG: carbamoyltransferase HypF [Acidobacteriota bacterium]
MERRSLAVRGIVQGVGFRPFVHSLASSLALTGFIRNAPHEVQIEIEGPPAALDDFERVLRAGAPAAASIDECQTRPLPTRGDHNFLIEVSQTTAPTVAALARVTPDIATCADCLTEVHDPANRRFRYPLITCAACGPRLTVVTGVPYDRERTTLAAFAMCEACRAEYTNPVDRRFHAQTISCPGCGPQVSLQDVAGRRFASGGDPIEAAAALLRDGKIIAVKSLGGYHLACDASNRDAIAALRHGKRRDAKPFAIMGCSLAAVSLWCECDAVESELLVSNARPIVLLRRRTGTLDSAPAESVAPGSRWLGVMLPSTPLHHLLIEAAGAPIVMTSGNHSDEPIECDDVSAREQLGGIASAFLTHDRRIQMRCDDSVTRVIAGLALPVRRSRGYAPRPIALPIACRWPMLAVGAQLKNTFALAAGADAIVSHHLGDLDSHAAGQALALDVAHYERLFGIAPRVVAHDAHPEYASTRYARERAATEQLETIAVQHHHAHVASCLAEHRRNENVIGVAFDGAGYGDDGTVWGGEFLIGDLNRVRRAAHFRPVAMPGGDQATREPWRMALAHLIDAGADVDGLRARVGSATTRVIERMIDRRINTPLTSSVGRLFDAVAAVALAYDRVTFEGQAAMQLEELAGLVDDCGSYETPLEMLDGRLIVDSRPLIRGVAGDVRAGAASERIARRFHSTIADVVATVCIRLRADTGIGTVALTGGVFQNAILTVDCDTRLTREGFEVLRHHLVPPGDGGVSLGQIAVAAARSQTCA